MNQVRETLSNYTSLPCSEYCRRLIREKLSRVTSATREAEELSAERSLHVALSYSTAEQRITDALCFGTFIPKEESESGAVATRRDEILAFISNLRSSKQPSPTRTSPIVSRLNEIWIMNAIGIGGLINIDRVHRNFFYKIISSDPVEDYVVFESSERIAGVLAGTDLQLSPESISFCTKERILKYISVAVTLIKRNFGAIDEIKMEAEIDPETGEEWLLIEISVQGRVEEVLDKYERYISEWVSVVPWPERHKIRLSYNII